MSIFDSIRRLLGDSPNGDGPDSSDTTGSSSDGTDPSPAGEEEMIPCEEALRLVNEYLDGELENVPRHQVRRHFEACGRCYPHLKFESAYREAVRRAAAGESAPAELKTKVGRLLAEARRED